jgi:hypothetical protein
MYLVAICINQKYTEWVLGTCSVVSDYALYTPAVYISQTYRMG